MRTVVVGALWLCLGCGGPADPFASLPDAAPTPSPSPATTADAAPTLSPTPSTSPTAAPTPLDAGAPPPPADAGSVSLDAGQEPDGDAALPPEPCAGYPTDAGASCIVGSGSWAVGQCGHLAYTAPGAPMVCVPFARHCPTQDWLYTCDGIVDDCSPDPRGLNTSCTCNPQLCTPGAACTVTLSPYNEVATGTCDVRP